MLLFPPSLAFEGKFAAISNSITTANNKEKEGEDTKKRN